MKDANGNELNPGDAVMVNMSAKVIGTEDGACHVELDGGEWESFTVRDASIITKKREIRTDPALMAAAPEPEVGPMDPALFCPR